MANLPRKAKPGRKWDDYDLKAHNMEWQLQTLDEFFGVSELPELEDPNIIPFTTTAYRHEATDDATYKLIHHLDAAYAPMDCQGTAFDTFVEHLLESMGYANGRRIIQTQYEYPFLISGESRLVAHTDVCLLDETNKVLLLARRSRMPEEGDLEPDPLPPMVAAAIAAFQYYNRSVTLKEMDVPAIAFYGTWPRFYKIKVTKQLSDSVRFGLYPAEHIVIPCHIPKHSPASMHTMGMLALENRVIVLRYLQAFKAMVEGESESNHVRTFL